jgi:TP901 family phage tail tape measure protein
MAENIGLAAILDTSNFEAGISRYLSGIDKMNAQTGQLAGSLGAGWDNMGKSVLNATALMGTALVGATAAAAAGIAAFTVNGIKGAADLEAQLSTVAAVLGKTTAETVPLKEAVYALALNPNLKVSVDEAAQAMEMLATNGLNMDQILGGAAEATVLLANATKADFGTAANVATDAMSVFNIKAEEMMGAVNGIVSVANVSKFGINDYALALAQGGAVAAGAGVEFNDFNTTIAATASNFSSGGDAGTSFKTFVTTLIPKSKEAAETMQQLGLMTAEGASAFFDASGNLKSMNDISVALQGALAGLSEEQRNNALATIFGSDASRTALGLMDAGKVIYTDAAAAARELGVSQEAVNAVMAGGVTQFEALQLQMAQTDALQNAKTNTDNFKSAMDILVDTFDAIGRQVGDLFLPMLKDVALALADMASNAGPQIIAAFGSVKESLAGLITLFQDMQTGVFGYDYDWNKVFPPWLAGIATGISVVVKFVSDNFDALAGAVGAVALVLAASGIQAAFVAISAALVAVNLPLLAVVAGAALLGAAWNSNFLGIKDITLQVVSAIGDALGELVGWFQSNGDTIKAAWDATGKALTATADFVVAGIRAAFGEETTWREQGAGIMANIQAGIESARAGLTTAVTNVATFVSEAFTSIDWKAVGTAILNFIKAGIDLQVSLLLQGLRALTTSMLAVFNAVDWNAVGKSIVDFIRAGIDLAKGALSTAVSAVATSIGDTFKAIDWRAVGMAILTGIGAGIGAATAALLTVVGGLVQLVVKAWNVDWNATGQAILTGIKTGVEFVKETFLSTVGTLAQNAAARFTDIDWNATGQAVLNGIKAGVDAVKEGFLTGFNAVATDSLKKFTDIDWNGLGNDIIDFIKAGVNAAKATLLTAASTLASDLLAKFTDIDWTEIGTGIISGIKQGFEDAKQGLIDKISAFADLLPQWLKDSLGIHSPARVMIPIGEAIVDGIIVGIGNRNDALRAAMTGLSSAVGDPFPNRAFVSGDLASQLKQLGTYSSLLKDLVSLGGTSGTMAAKFMADQLASIDVRSRALDLAKAFGIDPLLLGNIATETIDNITKRLISQTSATQAEITTRLYDAQLQASREFSLKPLFDQIAQQTQRLGQYAGTQLTGFFQSAASKIGGLITGIDSQIERAKRVFVQFNSPQAQEELNRLIAERAVLVEKMAGIYTQDAGLLAKADPRTEALLAQQLSLIEEAKALGVSVAGMKVLGPNSSAQDLVNLGVVEQLVAAKRLEKAQRDVAAALYLSDLPREFSTKSPFGALFQTRTLDPILKQLQESVMLEGERARLIAQYRAESEKLIALQRQEQQLDFLQQQLALVKEVKDNELDAGQIFAGMTLGINASISDLLTATQRTVQAMIAKVQAELQIHSPSRVFMRIGQQTIDGLRQGVQRAMQQPLMAQSVPHAAYTTRTLNFSMNNAINTPLDEVMLESRIMRVIERAL